MRAQSEAKLWRTGPVNCFLLCTVVGKQTRRLGRLMPDRRIPELITIALQNCRDYELKLDVDPGTPEVVRREAMQIGQITKNPRPTLASSPEPQEGSQTADAAFATGGQDTAEAQSAAETPLSGKRSLGALISVGNRVDSRDSRRNQRSVERKHSMSNSNGTDTVRIRQLLAMAENLCTQANHHRDNHNYLVAYALYGRALSVAQEIPEKDRNSIIPRIGTAQEAVFEMLRSGENGPKKDALEKAQKVGR